MLTEKLIFGISLRYISTNVVVHSMNVCVCGKKQCSSGMVELFDF